MSDVNKLAAAVRGSVEGVIFSKGDVIDMLLVAVLCRGHVLIEDVPGVGKTVLARALAASIGGQFKRIQCTPDLLPADVLGVSVFNPQTGDFVFKQGPVMSNVLLVDEINRATPRTQSALLEAMAEGQISVEGKALDLPQPFLVLATENPIEFEGTFPLPEAQKDRFFLTVALGYPTEGAELKILETQRRMTHPVTDVKAVVSMADLISAQKEVLDVFVHPDISRYIMDIVRESRQEIRLSLGVSPRGTLALYKGAQALAAISGREYVIIEDVKNLALAVLKKRIIVKSEYSIKGIKEQDVITDILDKVRVPVLKEV